MHLGQKRVVVAHRPTDFLEIGAQKSEDTAWVPEAPPLEERNSIPIGILLELELRSLRSRGGLPVRGDEVLKLE